jgi:threonine aldolase
MNNFIDLRSDTVTRPTHEMLEAMHSAKLGDDVFGDDPTVNLLQEKTAQFFGKEAALFFPSGTMANQIAIKTHTVPADEVICDETAHIYKYEGGGIAANSGVSVRLLKAERGIFSGRDIELNINVNDVHFPTTKLVAIENTVNRGGGACWPEKNILDVCKTAHKHNLKTHLDGARIWNAMVATGQKANMFGDNFDSISVCFSKGLGCPVGSILLGDKAFISLAHRHRKRFGGGMRQIGGLAAACIYALENNIQRLKYDHDNAKYIATELQKLNWVKEIMPVETNVIYFQLQHEQLAEQLLMNLNSQRILANIVGPGWMRFVFHLDISEMMVNKLNDCLKAFQF